MAKRLESIDVLRGFDMFFIMGFADTSKLLFGRLAGLFPPPWAGVASAVAYVATCWGLLYFLHRRQIYLKV